LRFVPMIASVAQKRRLPIRPLALCLLACLAGSALAQEWHGRHEREEHREMFFDNRFHHGHDYPAIGLSLSILPADAIALSAGPDAFYFAAGVWYRRAGPRFMVVRPPLGIMVPVLPPGYTMIWAGGAPYYYANETYYVQAPGGYVVAAPPTAAISEVPLASSTPPPPTPAATAAAPQAAGFWYYCESARAYYPYVGECREGWRKVPAAPPDVRR
jgi:Family of unknown function (DUF6515)